MIYIVTGASGFLGSTICRELISNGENVRTLCRSESAKSLVPQGVSVFDGDITDPSDLDKLFDVPDEIIVIHCAAYISVKKRDPLCKKINVDGTQNVIDACLKHHIIKLVFVGSVDALHNPCDGTIINEPDNFNDACPDSDYALSKQQASRLVLDAVSEGLNASICMPSAIIGPNDVKSLISTMFTLYIKGLPPFSISGGYDMVDVRDVSQGIISASKKEKSGIYVLSGHYVSITDLFDMMAAILGKKKTVMTFPVKLLYPCTPLIALYFKAVKKPPAITPTALWLLESKAEFSHKRACEELGYNPRPLKDTIIDTMEYFKGTFKKIN